MNELLLKEEPPKTGYTSYPDEQREAMERENWPIVDSRIEPAEVAASGADNSPLPDQKVSSQLDAQRGPLFPDHEMQSFRARWEEVQGSFVDEPRRAVEFADSLVASVVERITQQFAAERTELEKQWDKGNDVSTEDLRQAFKRYRTFFSRLLSF